MRTRVLLCVAAFAFVSLNPIMAKQVIQPQVIYGEDNRKDIYQPANDSKMVKLSRATVALVRKTDIQDYVPTPEEEPTGAGNNNDSASLPDATRKKLVGKTFGAYFDLCPSEPFHSQPSVAFCSGFLVGPDLMATAGHCIQNEIDCNKLAFVFGYAFRSETDDPTVVDESNIFYCKEIVKTTMNSDGPDYAIVKLDRRVTSVEPLNIRREGALSIRDEVTVIGNPSGIPTKIASGASVREGGNEGYFIANLDTYGGNSGSAVFNSETAVLEGILVRGETDFVFSDKGCYVSNVCAEDGCMGEHVTRAAAFSQFVPQLVPAVNGVNLTVGKISGNDNQALEPGESAMFSVQLTNSGVGTATNIKLSIKSSVAGVVITGDFDQVSELAEGSTTVIENLMISLDANTPCGAKIDLIVTASFAQGQSESILYLYSGEKIVKREDAVVDLAIPDIDKKGISSELNLGFAPHGQKIKVHVDITHTYIGDLEVSLTSPSGVRVLLWNHQGSSEDNLVGSFGDTLVPSQSMEPLFGENEAGIWTLNVLDWAKFDIGTFNGWGIESTLFQCQAP